MCRIPLVVLLSVTLSAAALGWGQDDTGKVTLTVVDAATDRPVPCRIHLKDAAGKPQRAPGLPFWHDHFVCPGTVQLSLPSGKYNYEIERGPEYAAAVGSFTLAAKADEKVAIRLTRLAHEAARGWRAGDLHIHRPPEDIELLMQAEDLHIGPVITWWNQRNLWKERKPPIDPLVRFDGSRFAHLLAGEDEREGGALLFFHLPRPLALAGSGREYPSPLKFVADARTQPGVWIDVEKPFWWDMPVWVASGQVDSIGLANNHMCRDRMYESEAWGKPRVVERLPAPLGNGYWSQEIYYHLLNCGIRLPPSAGSASGVLPNPVGYNRVYVYTGDKQDYASWWEGLRAGRSFVTNGPLLHVRAADQWPGHAFSAAEGREVEIEVHVRLSGRGDSIRFLDLVQDGQVRRVAVEDWRKSGALGKVRFQKSGWFLVRVIEDNPKTFRFASTAPYYVEIGATKHRISKASARLFLEWVRERMRRVKLDDPAQRQEVLRHHEMAEKFWQERVARANAE